MLTPQEVSSKTFPKAVMGGYAMANVDDFLDTLTEDYTNLYKDNAALKAKIKLLAEIANEITGADAPPYTMSGGTYGHRLPNAYAYGMSGNCPPADFPKGRGGAHGVDECVSLDRLKIAMRIYARALLRLNDILG